MTIEDAGVKKHHVGQNGNCFGHTIQIPWVYVFQREPEMIPLIGAITKAFCVLESSTYNVFHTARLIDEETGEQIDIELNSKQIAVYPTTNNHHTTSEKLLNILKTHASGGVT